MSELFEDGALFVRRCAHGLRTLADSSCNSYECKNPAVYKVMLITGYLTRNADACVTFLDSSYTNATTFEAQEAARWA